MCDECICIKMALDKCSINISLDNISFHIVLAESKNNYFVLQHVPLLQQGPYLGVTGSTHPPRNIKKKIFIVMMLHKS